MQVDELLKPFPIKEFHPFPRGLMGPGAHEIIGPEALKLGFKKTLVMTSGLRGSDIVHKITESMKYHGLEVVLYDKVESNPKDYNVMDAVGLYQQNECDSFVSIGGGSSHDACKGARVSVAHDGRNVNEFEGFTRARTRRTRRTSRCPPPPVPARRRPGPTSSPTAGDVDICGIDLAPEPLYEPAKAHPCSQRRDIAASLRWKREGLSNLHTSAARQRDPKFFGATPRKRPLMPLMA